MISDMHGNYYDSNSFAQQNHSNTTLNNTSRYTQVEEVTGEERE